MLNKQLNSLYISSTLVVLPLWASGQIPQGCQDFKYVLKERSTCIILNTYPFFSKSISYYCMCKRKGHS